MAKTYIAPKNGNVSLPSGFNSDFQRWENHASQPVEEITNWTTGAYQWNRGTGVEAWDLNAFGFAFKGGGVGTSNFGLGVMTATGGDTGGTATFTLDTGCNVTGTSFVVYDIVYHESRIEAAAKVTFRLKIGSADPTVTYAT
jgi:hypothetical protein